MNIARRNYPASFSKVIRTLRRSFPRRSRKKSRLNCCNSNKDNYQSFHEDIVLHLAVNLNILLMNTLTSVRQLLVYFA